MRFRFEAEGDPVLAMEREVDAAEIAVTRGVRKAGTGLRRDWRDQVRGALGYRMAGAIKSRNYPDGPERSIGAAALVYAPSKRRAAPGYMGSSRGGTAADVIDAHDRGAVITGRLGLWLAIPIGRAARMRGADVEGRGDRSRITPGGYERRTGRVLRFVYRKGQPSLLVDEGKVAPGNVMLWRNTRGGGKYVSPRGFKNRAEPVFLLVPRVKLREKMDLDRATRQWETALPGLIVAAWRD